MSATFAEEDPVENFVLPEAISQEPTPNTLSPAESIRQPEETGRAASINCGSCSPGGSWLTLQV